jgi:hypothetical protein
MGKSITDGNGTTTYFDTKGGKGEAMLFVPVAVHVEQVPLMIYFHGHADADKQQHNSVAEYIDYRPERDFRPLLKLKKMVLIEPWGGTYSRFGDPGTAAGLQALVDAALGKSNNPGSLILAGFSGGGAALKAVGLNLGGTLLSLVSEVWCLDCMYSGEGKDWGDWARKTGKRLRVGLSSGENSKKGYGPRAQVGNIGTGKTITTENFTCGHEELPGKCIQAWPGTP